MYADEPERTAGTGTATAARPYDSILELIGQTPIVHAKRLSPPGRDVYVKLEAFNPMGSVKDRLALGLIEAAEQDGSLKPGQTVVEASSGNTGIGLALVCARKGYPLVIVMAESFSVERRKILRFLGAKVVLTPAIEKGIGMLRKATELADTHGWFLPRQFENEANAATHERTTGMEIVHAFDDDPLDYFVSGLGTGGTIAGVSAALRKHSPQTRIIATEPDNSPLLGSHIPQQYEDDGSPVPASHPSFRPHPMQGWSPDFIPLVASKAVEQGLIDQVVPVSGDEAIAWSRRLAREEGIFCGLTGGATFATAYRVAEQAPEGSKVLAMLPDTGERYMTTPLFGGITEEMNADEEAISHSTPLCRFDISPGMVPAAAPPIPTDVDQKAEQHIEQFVADRDRSVLMFTLQWCEFCWSARKLLDALGVPYSLVELDGPEYRDLAWAGEVRRALFARTGAPTVPQIFIGGERLGGVTDLFDAYNNEELPGLLASAGIAPHACKIGNAYELLPAWMQPR